jgi:hypothetical protein
MLKLDTQKKRLEAVPTTELRTENILERYDLQKAIVNSWELFRNEIGLPQAFLIGEEVNPHSSTNNSIDILAFDPDDSTLIVIELKRDKNKLHLLQALSYAGMVSTWDAETVITKIQPQFNPEPDELIDLLKSGELSQEIQVVLIAEIFDPEVILTADWLSTGYSLRIAAFAIESYTMGDSIFLSCDQRYPLKELSEVYETRKKRVSSRRERPTIEWEDVIPKLKYSFGEKGIELCKRVQAGDPGRRRFEVRKNFDGFTWITLNFRENYINVYIKGQFDGAEELLQSKFKSQIEISTWRDGVSFLVSDEEQFDDLVQWLKLA